MEPVKGALDEVIVDFELEPARFEVSKDDLLRYTVASRDPNLIHHDPEVARASGLPNVIVQGTLKAGLLARFIGSHLGEGWEMEEFSVQYRGTDVVGQVLTARARVVSVDDSHSRIHMEAAMEDSSGAANTRGYAVLRRVARAAAR